MNFKNTEKIFLGLLVVVALLSMAGITLLILQAESNELAIFELMAFSISVIAVFLAVFGAITNVSQRRAMEKISRDIKGTIGSLKELDAESVSIKRKLSQDYALAQDIAEALYEAGIMANETEKRKNLAGHIEKMIRKKSQR